MNNRQKALKYLQNDILKNCDLITFLTIYPDEIDFIYLNDDGVCFNLISKNITCVSTDNIEAAKKAVILTNNINNCICKNIWDFEIFNDRFKFENIDECYQYVYNKNENFVPSKNVKQLSNSDIEYIKKHFTIDIEKSEIEYLMTIFHFYGYFIDNEIVGIIGRHIDGEIGFLEVLENYRRQGIAQELIRTIINEKSEIIPYSQVLVNNHKSISLQKKLGAIQNPTTVFWCYSKSF